MVTTWQLTKGALHKASRYRIVLITYFSSGSRLVLSIGESVVFYIALPVLYKLSDDWFGSSANGQ